MSALSNTLAALKAIPFEKRQAHYYCAIVLLQHAKDPAPFIYQAKWDGYILNEPKGEQGFGYDPVFFIPELACTAAELSLAQKNQYSHCAKAFFALKQHLNTLS